MTTVNEQNAAFDVVRSTIDRFIESDVPGFLQQSVREKLNTKFVLSVVRAALAAAEAERAKEKPVG